MALGGASCDWGGSGREWILRSPRMFSLMHFMHFLDFFGVLCILMDSADILTNFVVVLSIDRLKG